VVKSLRKHTDAFLDCHCMVSDPNVVPAAALSCLVLIVVEWIKPLAEAGADQMTIHYESLSLDRLSSTIGKIRESGMLVGVAIKPGTPAGVIMPYLEDVDMVLVMTVEPGFGGQRLGEDCVDKVRTIRKRNGNVNIQVDGGITLDNLGLVAEAGANVVVAGTLIFNAPDKAKMISDMRRIMNESASVVGRVVE